MGNVSTVMVTTILAVNIYNDSDNQNKVQLLSNILHLSIFCHKFVKRIF